MSRLMMVIVAAMLATGCAAAAFVPMENKIAANELAAAAQVDTKSDSSIAVKQEGQFEGVKRVLVYQAGLKMVVADVGATQRSIQQEAAAAGGYLQEINGTAIAVRVPTAAFEPVLAWIERLGEVTDRQVKVNDVTEEMRDLTIRLENAERVRGRLEELLAKAEKMEDTIKLEQELERVTETIELLKGKMQFLKEQVAYSTIRVELNSVRAQGVAATVQPFGWVRELGDGAAAGISAESPDTSRIWARSERFDLPAGFVRYYEKDVTLKNGTAGRVMTGTKDLGATKQGYLLGMVTTKRYVYTFEAWGEKAKVDAVVGGIVGAFETLEVKEW
jgi:hypothetical protein